MSVPVETVAPGRRPTLLWGLAVFVLALIPRVAYVVQDDSRLGLDVSRLDQTDNYVFAAWARIIAAGDVLCLEQPHAVHHWTEEVAPEDKWLEWYGGARTFHQAPLYPYFVAAVFKVLGDEHLMVALAQAVLGALTCWMTYLLTVRCLGLRAGVIAGLLLAFMGSFYFYDAFILRDGPMALLVAVLAYALQRAVESDRLARWFLAGCALGLFALAKETGMPLMALTLIGVGVWKRRTPGAAASRGAAVVLGFLLLLSPAVARNVAVGAPAFKLSTRGPEVIVTGNAIGQTGVGWNPPVDLMRHILMDANASLPKAFALTLATHRARPLGWFAILAHKTRAFFNGYEVPNNVDFYLHRSHLPTLRLGFVSMSFLAPACLLGLLVCLPRRRKLVVPYLLFVAVAGSVIALYILARFRLQALPLMALFAAGAVDWGWTSVQQRRWPRLTLAALLFATLTAWSWFDQDPFGERNKHTGIMLKLAKIGDFDRALRYRDLLLEALAGDEEMDDNMAAKLQVLTDAFARFEQAETLPDTDALRHVALGDGYGLLLGVTKRGDLRDFHTLASRHYQRALTIDPDVVGAHHGLGTALASVARNPPRGEPTYDMGPALSAFQQELRRHPHHGPSHRDAGFIHYAWGNARQAFYHLLEAERLGVADGRVLATLAHVSIDPQWRDQPAVAAGGVEVPLYDVARAGPWADRALALSPDDPSVLDLCADVRLVQHRHDDAVDLLERVIALQPWREKELRHRIDAFRLHERNMAARAQAAREADEVPADDSQEPGP